MSSPASSLVDTLGAAAGLAADTATEVTSAASDVVAEVTSAASDVVAGVSGSRRLSVGRWVTALAVLLVAVVLVRRTLGSDSDDTSD